MTDLRMMSRDFLTEFIALYKNHKCLWKIKSKDYSDKNKKNAAYSILVQKLKEVDSEANKDAVVKKINSLRTCFRKELKKYNLSMKSGSGTDQIYKPNLWYFDLLIFLTDQEMPRQDGRDNLEENIGSPIGESEDTSIIVYDSSDMNELEGLPRPQSANSHASTSGIDSPRSSMSMTSTATKKKKRDRSDDVAATAADIFCRSGILTCKTNNKTTESLNCELICVPFCITTFDCTSQTIAKQDRLCHA